VPHRVDYFDDPAAPAPNSLVVAASAVVLNDAGHVLMIERSDSGSWSLPGGALELGESLTACAVREVKEETGVDVAVTGLVGIYSDPRHVIAYADGEVRQQFNVCFTARQVGGALRGSDESTRVAYVDPGRLDELTLHRTQRTRLQHFLEQRPVPYVD
jgi:ADP-ribose pyrophosphatase YjhB (NUDIX family)